MTKLAKILSFCTALTLSSQVMAFELTHSEGTIKLDKTPETIATYDPAVLDSLDYLGIEVDLMPNIQERPAFKKYADLKPAGTLFEPDYDVLNEAKPDIIFVARRTAAKQEELSKVAPVAFYSFNNFNYFEDFKTNNLNLAKAFGKEAEAQAKLDEIDADMKKLHEINKDKTGVFMMVLGNGRVAPHVEGDLFGFSYDLFGLTPVLEGRDPNTPPAPRPAPDSPEAKAAAEARAKQVTEIAEANPDWLIVFDRQQLTSNELTADKTLQEHPELGQLDAVKNNKIIFIEPSKWYLITGGLNNIHNIVKQAIEEMK
ncbi:MAG: ABC transporter substrate-binding protein [Alcaligenaceae bacterium]|nr:ABC transporter substrate-binding protein [Alcaligenaceae bacterium]